LTRLLGYGLKTLIARISYERENPLATLEESMDEGVDFRATKFLVRSSFQ
jgi:hypothetical protein